MTSPDDQLDDLIADYLQQVDDGFPVELESFGNGYSSEVRRKFQEYIELQDGLQRLAALGGGVQSRRHDTKSSYPGTSEVARGNVGDVVGGYRLQRRLSQGGMGVIYVAQDARSDGLVALKLLRGEIRNERTYQRRLERESRAIASLDHPHVVPPIAAGIDQGIAYLAMQLIDGISLDHVIEFWLGSQRSLDDSLPDDDQSTVTTPISEARISDCVAEFETDRLAKLAELLADIADALHVAHQNGFVHRDIKPSNMLLDVHGKAWLTDFGLASMGGDETELTQSGDVIGTPAYMSPEQASGHSGGIEKASDIYSFGVTLYELATLQKPFTGSRQRIILDLLAGKFTLPSKIYRGFPPALEAITCKAMETNPNHRYPSARDLATDLRKFAKGSQVSVQVPGKIQRSLRWCERNPRTTFTAAVGCVVATVLVFAVQTASSWYLGKLNAQLSQANTQLEEANRDLDFSQSRLQRELYVADLRSAFEAYNNRDLPAMQELLERYGASESNVMRSTAQRFLEALVQPPKSKVLAKHTAAATQIAIAVQGAFVLSAGHDGQVIKSNLDGEYLDRYFIGGKLDALAIDERAGLFLTGKNVPIGFNAVDFFDLELGNRRSSGAKLWYGVEEVTVSPNGRLYAAAERYHNVVVFDSDGQMQTKWSSESRNESLEFLDDSVILGLSQKDENRRYLAQWDMRSEESKPLIPGIQSFAVARHSSQELTHIVAAGRHDLQVREWPSMRTVWSVEGLSSRVRCVDIDSDLGQVIAGCDDGTVYFWQGDLNTPASPPMARIVQASKQRVTDILLLPPSPLDNDKDVASETHIASPRFVTSSEDGLIQLHTLPPQNPIMLSVSRALADFGLYRPFRDVQEDAWLYLPCADGELRRMDVSSLEVDEFYAHFESVQFGLCSGKSIFLASAQGIFEIDRNSGQRLRSFDSQAPEQDCRSMLISNGSLFALYGSRLVEIVLDQEPNMQVHFLPADDAVALLPSNGDAIRLQVVLPKSILELTTGGLMQVGETADSIKNAFAHANSAQDATRLALVRNTDQIEVRHLGSGRQLTLTGHRQGVNDLEFLDGGESLLSAAYDGTVRFWDLETERELGRLEFTRGTPDWLDYFPEQGVIVMANRNGDLRVWRTK